MAKRTKLTAFSLIIFVLVGGFFVSLKNARTPTSDEEKYKQMMGDFNWLMRVRWFESKSPDFLSRWLGLWKLNAKFQDGFMNKQKELSRSGYFSDLKISVTNLSTTTTNVERQMQEIQSRLSKNLPQDAFYLFHMNSNVCFMTCKTKEISQVKNAVLKP